MELGPIPSIRGISKATSVNGNRELQLPLHLERSERLGEDNYNASQNHAGRRLEDEDPEPPEEPDDTSEGASFSVDPESTINLLA